MSAEIIRRLEEAELPDPEASERAAVFWGAEATKSMLQGDHEEARICLARAKRHTLNALRIRRAALNQPGNHTQPQPDSPSPSPSPCRHSRETST